MQVQIKAALWVLWQRLLFLGQTATSEGVDASITITIGRGDILHKFRGRHKVYNVRRLSKMKRIIKLLKFGISL